MDGAAALIRLACFKLHGIVAQSARMVGSVGHWKPPGDRTPPNYIYPKKLTVQFCSKPDSLGLLLWAALSFAQKQLFLGVVNPRVNLSPYPAIRCIPFGTFSSRAISD